MASDDNLKESIRDRQADVANQHGLGQQLLQNIKARLLELEKLLKVISSYWHGEGGFYRFYHQSFRVYRLQEDIESGQPPKCLCR